tara:strand:+ start:106 stop:1209 length:1104 start_codon:yes stop_codon:yes gene_type:complete
MYDVLTGKQRALVFPVMCNADVKIDYSDNVPDSADDVGYGIWSHSGDFTFEAIVTPYDINGVALASLRGRTESNTKKIMPHAASGSQSNIYLPIADAITHEMRIFSSTNFYISLKNATATNANQPSEYKILVGIKLSSGAVQEFITDNAVIIPTKDRAWAYSTSSLSGFNQEGRIEYEIAATLNSAFSSGGSVLNCIAVDANTISDDEPLFIRSGYDFTAIGTVSTTNTSANTITLASAYNVNIADEALIYRRTYADPTYINNSFHIACTYDEIAKNLNIYFNGLLVKTGTHGQSGTFSFEDEDLFIGANGNRRVSSSSAIDNKQFMGEMHEMCLTSVIRRRFPSTNTLHPNYNDTLFYFRFEEVDL